MKKMAAFAITITVLSLSVTALAEVAATDSGKEAAATTVTGADDYSIVLISESGGKVVYANQADTSFDASVDFLLKEDPEYGKYIVQLGGEDIAPASTYFYVGVDAPTTGDVTMKRLKNEERSNGGKTYRIGYYAEVKTTEVEEYKSLKVGYSENPAYGGFDFGEKWDDTHYEGEGDLYLIFQLNDVPKEWKDSVTVFLSPDAVSDTRIKENAEQEEG